MLTWDLVDERDVRVEVDRPTYRVGLWTADSTAEVWQLTGGTVSEVLAWAEGRVPPGGRVTVGVLFESQHGLGQIHLHGDDPTRS